MDLLLLTRYLWYFVCKKTLIALLVTNSCRPTTHILRTLLEDEQKRSLVPNRYQTPVKRSVIWNKEGDKTTKPISKKLDTNTCNRSSTHYHNQYHDHNKCQECIGSKGKASYISDYSHQKKSKQAFKMSKLYHNHITSDETRARLSAITSKK